MLSRSLVVAAIMLALAVVLARADGESHGLAVFKLGESFATDEHAGEAIDALCAYLGERIDGAAFKRTGVRNAPADALRLIRDERPAVAIVSPGFYFRYKADLELTVLAEARRGGKDGEQYTLAGLTEADGYPAGKRIATTLALDTEWLNRAVLPAPEGAAPVRWVRVTNLFDAGYDMVDGQDDAPDFVLLDRVSLAAFKADDDLADLKYGEPGKLLPQDLVVEVAGRLGDTRDTLKRVLAALDGDDEGRRIGELIQSPTFNAPDTERLEATGKPWQPKD
jgi:hypothetical protein